MPFLKDQTIEHSFKKILIVLCDVSVMMLAFVFSEAFISPLFTSPSRIVERPDAIVVSVISYLFVVAWKPSVLLRPFVRADEVVQNVFQTLLLHFFVLLATLSLFTTVQISSLSVIFAYLAFFVLLCAEKLVLLQIIKKKRTQCSNRRHVLMVGPSSVLQEFIRDTSGRNAEVTVDGFFSAEDADVMCESASWLGTVEQVGQYLNDHPEVHSMFCCHEYLTATELCALFQCCEHHNVAFYALPQNLNVLPFRMGVDRVGALNVLGCVSYPLQCWANRATKRLLDILLSLSFIVTIFPILYVVVFIVLKRKSPGPVFVRRKQEGANGKRFETFEFRAYTLPVSSDLDKEPSLVFTGNMYRTIICRLPMLLNVLMGDMSFVGPAFAQIDAEESTREQAYKYIRNLKPGLTGWAQIQKEEPEAGTPHECSTKHNLWYAQNWSLWLDVYIMLSSLRQNPSLSK